LALNLTAIFFQNVLTLQLWTTKSINLQRLLLSVLTDIFLLTNAVLGLPDSTASWDCSLEVNGENM